MPLFLQF